MTQQAWRKPETCPGPLQSWREKSLEEQTPAWAILSPTPIPQQFLLPSKQVITLDAEDLINGLSLLRETETCHFLPINLSSKPHWHYSNVAEVRCLNRLISILYCWCFLFLIFLYNKTWHFVDCIDAFDQNILFGALIFKGVVWTLLSSPPSVFCENCNVWCFPLCFASFSGEQLWTKTSKTVNAEWTLGRHRVTTESASRWPIWTSCHTWCHWFLQHVKNTATLPSCLHLYCCSFCLYCLIFLLSCTS